MATEGIKYLYYSFLLLIKDDLRYIDDNKLLNSYINIIKDDNNFYLMKISQMLKKFPDLMVKIDPLIYKAYSDDLYFHIIKNHPYIDSIINNKNIPDYKIVSKADANAVAAATAAAPGVVAANIAAGSAANAVAAAAAPAAAAAAAPGVVAAGYFPLAAPAAPAAGAAPAAPAAAAAVVNALTAYNTALAAPAAGALTAAEATAAVAVAAINAYASAAAAAANVPVNYLAPAFAFAPAPATNLKIKLFCDLILFDILCRMDFNRFDNSICESNNIIKKFLTNIIPLSNALNSYTTNTINIIDNTGNNTPVTRQQFLRENKRGIEKMNDYIGNFTIPMNKKIILYKILNFLINDNFIDDNANPNPNAQIIKIMFELITHETNGCAPRTIIEELSIKGGKKSGKYEYFLCKCNFKDSLKKIVAKSAREAAKILAKKVLKDKKKSAKFTLKRMIGKKEKYYNYESHFDKSGKIIIKNQS
jgi:hypothetical protein